PPSPDYIPGPEYPEYLPPADDVLPAEEQPQPAAVSPTTESPGYITVSEPEMEPEEEDGDDEKSEEDSIDYLTSGGDNDADDDGDDLSMDDADDEDEESSDSKEEEEEHLAPTVPTPALYSSVSAFEETEPFEEGETTATPPPFGYRYITDSETEMDPKEEDGDDEKFEGDFIDYPTSRGDDDADDDGDELSEDDADDEDEEESSDSEEENEEHIAPTVPSIPEADMPLRKRTRFTTPTGRYEVGESSVAVAARQIRPALTVDDSRRAEDRL
nr:hypothetical protein [Tanacetum cinerariifolium]